MYLPVCVTNQPEISGFWVWLIAKPWMICTSSRCIYALRNSTFHEWLTGLMRCSTIKDGFKNWGCVFGFADLGRGAGIHWPFHTEIDLPFSTLLISPFLSRDRADRYFSNHKMGNKICKSPLESVFENTDLWRLWKTNNLAFRLDAIIAWLIKQY